MDIGKLFRDAWGLFIKDIGPLIVGMLIASLVPTVAAVVIVVVTFGASFSGLETNAQGEVTSADPASVALLIGGGVLVIAVTLLLSVPLYVGLLAGVLKRVREGRAMTYGDAWSGFRVFGKVIWATVLLGLVFTAIILVPTAVIVGGAVAGSGILIGLGVLLFLVAMVGYVYLGISWTYVFPVIVDRGLGVTAAMGESRRLVHGTGWWWTFLVLFLVQLVVGAIGAVLGLVPLIGWVATFLVYPFVLTYLVAMYFQARDEGRLVDAVLGWPRQAPVGPPAYSAPAAPYGTGSVPAPPPYAAPPAAPVEQGQAYVPAPPPLTPPADPADEAQGMVQAEPQTAVTQPAAPAAPAEPAMPQAPPAPEPPGSRPGE